MVWGSRPGLGRALIALIVALAVTQWLVAMAHAVTPGHNGRLLLASTQGTTFPATAPVAPQAQPTDCYSGLAMALWTVGINGTGIARVGGGDSGLFSPDGRTLLTSSSPGCYSGNVLSLSQAPFHSEHPIPAANFTGADWDASLGPWLGSAHPTFLDPTGIYRDAITGRRLFLDSALPTPVESERPLSCSGYAAEQDGTIGTPVRRARRIVMAWQRIAPRSWLGTENETSMQWSPSGRYVYYTTWSRRVDRLFRVTADGTGRQLLFHAPASADLLSSLSPDGRWLLLATNQPSGGQRLAVIGASGQYMHTVTPQPAGLDVTASAQWSPRGDLLLVDGSASNDSTGTSQPFVYLVAPNGGPRRDVSLPGFGVWSPDERFIAYTTASQAQSSLADAQLVIYAIATGQARTVLTASVPIDTSASQEQGLAVVDWQTVPGSARSIPCAQPPAPFWSQHVAPTSRREAPMTHPPRRPLDRGAWLPPR